MKFDVTDGIMKNVIRNCCIIVGIGIAIVIFLVSWFHPSYGYSDFFLWINVITTASAFITLGLVYILFTLSSFGIIQERWRYIPLSLLIALPLIWQISQLVIINFSGNLFDQYPPLLPAVRVFFEYLSNSPVG
jgi:hypothetical protein